jgi:hypothetical protein
MCKQKLRGVWRFLDKGDAKLTGNMWKHARKCWGEDVVAHADKASNANEVHWTTVKGSLDPQSIMAVFEQKGRDKVTYSHLQHTKSETQAEIVQWVSESKRPFNIVNDRGFQLLMKGRPNYYIPSPTTISQDVKHVFTGV